MKAQYVFYSFYEFLLVTTIRIGCFAAIPYLLLVYEERPPVILPLIVIAAAAFLWIGNDVFRIYTDRMTRHQASIIHLCLGTKKQVYRLQDYRLASARIPERAEASELVAAIAVQALTNYRPRRQARKPEPLFLQRTDGTIEELTTMLSHDTVKELAAAFNGQLAAARGEAGQRRARRRS